MTERNKINVLDHGHVILLDHMGDDQAIVDAARISYGKGTKSVKENEALIRYLMRHEHHTPFEMCVVKLGIKLPIFVMRQLVRHRSASLNEVSARYSIVADEYYLPKLEDIKDQSTTNKQGRGQGLSDELKQEAQDIISDAYEFSFNSYSALIETEQYPMGVARELSRIVLPVGTYTEVVWCQNLRNLFHLLKLRTDPHAQYEIREYANAIFTLIEPLFPVATKAYVDYVRDAKTLSRMELDFLLKILEQQNIEIDSFEEMAYSYGISKREFSDLKTTFSRTE